MTLGVGPSPRSRLLAYCLYDFGNSAFTTIIVTVVYSVYFRTQVAAGHPTPDLLWGFAVSLAMGLVAIVAPVLGARADEYGSRHTYLIGFTLLSVVATAGLVWVGPGNLFLGILLFVIAHVGYAGGEAFYNAFLPDVAEPHRIGFVSGLAWGVGYFGGLLSLLVAVSLLGSGPTADTSVLGHQLVFIAVAAQYLLFTSPALLLLRDRRGRAPSRTRTLERLLRTLREARQFRQVFRFLIAYFLYDNGLSVIIAFTSIYMSTTLGFSMREIINLFVFLQLTSAAGALASGAWADRFGTRRAIIATLILWIGIVVGMAITESRSIFKVIALVGGLGIGSTQACSRALLAHLVPETKRAEFFGLFAFCTKASGVLGPPLFGFVSDWTGSARLAMMSVLFFFISGLILLLFVDEDEGRRIASQYRETPASSPA